MRPLTVLIGCALLALPLPAMAGTVALPTREAGALYRIQVIRVDVAATHDGRPWDQAHGEVAPKTGATCCHGSTMGDGAEPDLRVTATVGAQRFSTRVVRDQTHGEFSDYGFVSRAQGEPITLEVWDSDDGKDELIGSITYVPEAKKGALPGFGAVLRAEVSLERIPSAKAVFTVEGNGDPVQATPLYVLAGQTLQLAVTGKMCVGEHGPCTGPEGLPERAAAKYSVDGDGRPALLLIQTGSDGQTKQTPFRPGMIISAAQSGPLAFRVTTVNGHPLVGAYTVEAVVRP